MGSSVDQYAVLALLFLLAVVPEPSAAITWDSGCGVTKGCFPNCPGGCDDYLVTWQDTGSAIDFTLTAVARDGESYLAVAFSDDYRMGDDSVVACITAGTASVTTWYNEGTEAEELSPATLGLSSTSVSSTNGEITCSFTRAKTAGDSKFFDLDNDYYMQLTLGEGESEGGSSKMGHHYMIPWFTDSKVNFNANYIVDAYKLCSPLVKLHGIMMVLAWLLFSLVGILTARYNKDMLPETKLFGTKVWFQLHRGLMIAVVVCVVIGFIPIFVEIEGYSQIPAPKDEGFTLAHPVLGIIVTVLAFLNPIGALLRPGPDHKFRWIFNWGHLAVGVITQFLAVLVIFFGYVLDRSELSVAAIIVTGIQLFAIAVFVVALELNKFFASKKKGTVNISMSSKTDLAGDDKKPAKQEGPNSKLPFIALIVFSVVMFCFAMSLLGIIAAA